MCRPEAFFRLPVLAAVVALALLSSSTASAEEEPRVGVVVALPVNTDLTTALGIASKLGLALEEKLLVVVLSGQEAHDKLETGKLPEDCLADKECIRGVGVKLDVDELLMLVVLKVGDQIKIETTWADARSGETEARAPIEFAGDSIEADAFKTYADKLLPKAAPKKAPAATQGGHEDGVVKAPEPEVSTERRGRHLTTTSTIVGAVGAAGVLVGLGYAGYFASTEGGDPTSQTKTADIIGFSGAAFLGIAAVLYLTSADDGEAPKRQLSLGGGSDSISVGYGGRF